jgi:putative DNA-invertase from lambdoid prophage Rac
MLRAGLYARVSTLDQQTLPMQMRAMRDYAAKRGWTIAMDVKEVGSGAIAREQRQLSFPLIACANGINNLAQVH